MRPSRLGLLWLIFTSGSLLAQSTSSQLESDQAGSAAQSLSTNSFFITNGVAVLFHQRHFYTNIHPDPSRPPFNKPEFDKYRRVVLTPYTNVAFSHFISGTPQAELWSDLLRITIGRSSLIWSQRQRSANWPRTPPSVTWNRQGLLWGLSGFTAISPSWEGESNPGQIPITALTRRHGYTRGHSMGPAGFRTALRGKKVWFLSPEDELIEVRILREVVRFLSETNRSDYTIVLFDRDLPEVITPPRVIRSETWAGLFARQPQGVPLPAVLVEQGGHASVNLPGFKVDTWKGGDSGSPNFLVKDSGLIFYGGRSSSGPGSQMQADMDALCRSEKLNPMKYQLRWAPLEPSTGAER